MAFTVGELSRLTGVTVRALHHYDEIGLVRPSQRTAGGYRLYEDGDVLRLQRVLLYRELGLPLDAIAAALGDESPPKELLRKHRDTLVRKRARIDEMLAALDHALGQLEKGTAMSNEDIEKLFDGFNPAHYEEEAEQRWGGTPAYEESMRRTKSYTREDWETIKAEGSGIYQRVAHEMNAGSAVRDAAVQAAVEAHRRHIERWFYPCSKELHRGLGAMYVADQRFADNLNKVAPGLAQYLSDAIAAS